MFQIISPSHLYSLHIQLPAFFIKSLPVPPQFCVVQTYMKMNQILLNIAEPVINSESKVYLIGMIISLLILCYLIYSLVKPEKF